MLSNMSAEDYSNLENCQAKVQKYLSYDQFEDARRRQDKIKSLTQHSIFLLDSLFTTSELKTQILPNLKQVECIRDTDLMWRINMYVHRKTCKKQDLLVLMRDVLNFIA